MSSSLRSELEKYRGFSVLPTAATRARAALATKFDIDPNNGGENKMTRVCTEAVAVARKAGQGRTTDPAITEDSKPRVNPSQFMPHT